MSDDKRTKKGDTSMRRSGSHQEAVRVVTIRKEKEKKEKKS